MPKKIEKEPTEGNYTTIKLPNDLVLEMDKLIGKHGFKSRAEIIKEALRELLTHYKPLELPRFEHFNIDENSDDVRIVDHTLATKTSPNGRIIDIFLKSQGIFCDYDQCDNCDHVEFVLTIPAVQQIIRKRRKEGLIKLPDV